VHRDLKPENLLCADDPYGNIHIYVADFGLSRLFNEEEQLTTYCGSPEYVGKWITFFAEGLIPYSTRSTRMRTL
jgi:serine/threonine protein kinase